MSKKVDSSKYYSKDVASNYDSDRESNILRRAKMSFENKAVHTSIGWLEKNSSVLDAPCGTGRFLPFLKDRFIVYGCDISQDMIDNIPHDKKQHVQKIYTGAIGDLPFDNQQFDYTLCMRFFNLFPLEDAYNKLEDLCRVSKKGVLIQVRFNTSFNLLLKFIKKSKQLYYNITNKEIAQRESSAPDGITFNSFPKYKNFETQIQKYGFYIGKSKSVSTVFDSQKMVLLKRKNE